MGLPKLNNTPKKDLNQLKLTEEQLSSGEFPQEEVFLLKNEDGELGYFWQYDLKDFVQQDTSFEENTFIQKWGTEQWIPLFEHPFFQRRKPQVVSNVERSNNQQKYFVLEQGQKIGPFTIEEITEQVEHKKLLLTDMISVDEGHSWCKIYDLEEFDRRNGQQAGLPHAPERDVLSHSEADVTGVREAGSTDATENLAGLAYIGKSKAPIIEIPEEEQEATSGSSKNLQYVWMGLLFFSIIGIGAIVFTGKEEKNTSLSGNTDVQRQLRNKARLENSKAKQQAKRAPAQENTAMDRAERNRQEQLKRRERMRRSTPFKKSKTFKRAERMRDRRNFEVNNDRYEEDNYYDDGTDPVELDPVRKTLSKDTIDPALEEEEDPYEDEYAAEEAELEKERREEERKEEDY